MSELTLHKHATTPEQRAYYASIYVLKRLDLAPKDGGIDLPVVLPHDWYPLEGIIEGMVLDGLVSIHRRKGTYALTAQGIDLVGRLIDEAESYIEEFAEREVHEMVETLSQRGVDLLRARFLWGWYDEEFDDLIEFQRIRGMEPVQKEWAEFLLGPAFYENLAQDL